MGFCEAGLDVNAIAWFGIDPNTEYIVLESEELLQIVLPAYQPIGLEIYAVYPSRHNMPGRVRLFLDFLREEFRNAAQWQAQPVS